jgi:hypothetical protein
LPKIRTMGTETQFIEIMRVISSNHTGVNTHSSPEMLEISRIGACRGWIKGKNDEAIKGDITLVVLKPEKKEDGTEKKVSMLIEESYNSFIERLGAKVIIKRVNGTA